MSVEQAVDAFWESARRGIYSPPEWKGRLTREEAYRVQLGMLERYVRGGDRHAGWKVGLTSKAMQVQQRVRLERERSVSLLAPTWSTRGTGLVARRSRRIRQNLRDQVDQFVAAYRAVNASQIRRDGRPKSS